MIVCCYDEKFTIWLHVQTMCIWSSGYCTAHSTGHLLDKCASATKEGNKALFHPCTSFSMTEEAETFAAGCSKAAGSRDFLRTCMCGVGRARVCQWRWYRPTLCLLGACMILWH